MYWDMPKYQIAWDKASEILNMISYAPEEMVRTNDIIDAVKKILDADVIFTKYDFSKLGSDDDKQGTLANCGAMMFVSNGTEGRKAAIFLNDKETPEMIRFSLVHELGHLMTTDWETLGDGHISTHIDMDITSIPEEVLEDPKYSFLIKEQVANIFALLVLIPYDSLMKAIRKHKSLEAVAEFFGVERNAVISRLMLEGK